MDTSTATQVDVKRGLAAAEVAERVARGEVNDVPDRASRSIGEIVRANVFTRFNAIIGVLLVDHPGRRRRSRTPCSGS